MWNGWELDDDKTLAACGVPNEDDVNIIVVRKQLVAEGWKLRFEDNEDSDTEEDDSFLFGTLVLVLVGRLRLRLGGHRGNRRLERHDLRLRRLH